MTEKRQPWGKWYWGDWRKDARLRRCTYAARGLWADMLSLMGGECERFGALIMDGQPLVADDLVSMLGGSEREVSKMLGELEAKRVFNRVGDADVPDDVAKIVADSLPVGTIISRRMIRDKAKADQDRLNGKGGGNPKLKSKDNGNVCSTDNDGVNPPDKAQKLEARDEKPERKKDSEANASGAGAPSLEAEVFRRGKEVFGQKAGGQITKLRQCLRDDMAVLALINEGKTKENRLEWLAAVIKRRGANPDTDDLGLPLRERYDAGDDYQRMGVDV